MKISVCFCFAYKFVILSFIDTAAHDSHVATRKINNLLGVRSFLPPRLDPSSLVTLS